MNTLKDQKTDIWGENPRPDDPKLFGSSDFVSQEFFNSVANLWQKLAHVSAAYKFLLKFNVAAVLRKHPVEPGHAVY